jgi:hypothetical protein
LVARIVRDDEVGGSNPLAPTILTDLAFELQDRRQCSVEAEVDGVRRELVFEPLEAQNPKPGERSLVSNRKP